MLNWGESTFIPGGLSVINSVDVSALRVAGAELREAFRPEGMVWGSFDLSSNLSVEGFYQYEWEETVIDPPGTFFSTNDFAGLGGETVFLVFATFRTPGCRRGWYAGPWTIRSWGSPAPDPEVEDDGQYGLALRWFVPELDGTEFGFYFVNYHSRLPTINGVTGTLQGALAARGRGGRGSAVYTSWAFRPESSPRLIGHAGAPAGLAGTDANSSTARISSPTRRTSSSTGSAGTPSSARRASPSRAR